MSDHSCPQGITIEVEHDYYLSRAHDQDPNDPIGAKHWIGAGFKVIASCATCDQHLSTKKYTAYYEHGELTVDEDHRN